MNITKTTESDVIPIKELVESLTRFYSNDPTKRLPAWFLNSISEQEIINRIVSAEFYNLSYKIDGNLVGYIAIKNNYQLYNLFVSEHHHRCGIAKKLWLAAKEATASKKYFLRSSIYAIPVYERFGFSRVGGPTEKDGIQFQLMEYGE